MQSFDITYAIISPKSAEQGDFAETGFIEQNVTSLRDAIHLLFETRTCEVSGISGIEANTSDINNIRWVSVFNGMEFITGSYEERSLHFSDNITQLSRKRIFNLVQSGMYA